MVYAKRPFACPDTVLRYLSRYTHRVAISNRRLIALDERGVTFRWKDYRAKGRSKIKTMTLGSDEFMRRFLMHVLPAGFHRIRHYGLIANGARRDNLAKAQELLHPADTAMAADVDSKTACAHEASTEPTTTTYVCSDCGAVMCIVNTLAPSPFIRAPPHRASG